MKHRLIIGRGRVRFIVDKAAIRELTRRMAAKSHRSIHNAFAQPKTGQVYNIGGKKHTASAPGQPPAIFTGMLDANNFMVEHKKGFTVGILNKPVRRVPGATQQTLGYARDLEIGNRKFEPRPVLRPAMYAAMKGQTIPRNAVTVTKL